MFEGVLNGEQAAPEPLFTPTEVANLPRFDSLGLPRTEKTRLELAEAGSKNLYVLCRVILGYKDLNPRVHMPMCDYYDDTRDVYNRRCSLMPRTHYKTTIWTIAESIGDVIRDCNVRILMIADTGRNAQLFMMEIQQHFQYNEVFRWVYPNIIPENIRTTRWNQNEMLVPRTIIAREPTIDAIGALGGSESRHYDKIRADDLITEKCVRSTVEMDKIILWANGLESLLTKQSEGQIDFVGSRKKKGDLYEQQIDNYGDGYEVQELGPYVELHGEMVVFTRQALEQGKPIFPENIKLSFLHRLRKTDPQRYHAQYANSPKGSGLNTFDMESLRFYKIIGDLHKGGVISCMEGDKELLRVSPWSLDRMLLYDPAVAEKQSNCQNAMIVLAKGSGPFRIILETRIGHYDPSTAMEYLFELQAKWQLNIISIEKRGFQGWVKYALADKAEYEGLPYLPIVEWPPKGHPVGQWAKPEHIRSMQPVVRSNYLWLHESQTELRDLLEFYPNVRWDDGLDALAQSITYCPMMMDESERMGKKVAEIDHLEHMLLGSTSSYDEPWDEAAFLDKIDFTGYGLKAGFQ